jgi:hypothetical protein
MRILLDLEARDCDARRVRQAQVTLGATRLARYDFDFPRPLPTVVVKGRLLADVHKEFSGIDSRRTGIAGRGEAVVHA